MKSLYFPARPPLFRGVRREFGVAGIAVSLRPVTPFSNSMAARLAASLIPTAASTGFAVERMLSLANGSVNGAWPPEGCIMPSAEGPEDSACDVEVGSIPKDGIRELKREARVLAKAVRWDEELVANVVATCAPAAISST